MSREYYYLIAGLPDLFIDQERKDFNLLRIKEEMQELMHPEDYQLVELLFLEYDNYNFLNEVLKRKQEFNPLGKFSIEFFQELDENIQETPSYMREFFLWLKGKSQEESNNEEAVYSDEQSKKSPEVRFQEFFYSYIAKNNDNRFIKQWFSFLRTFNNILAAVSSRNHGLEVESQLVGDDEITEVLSRSQTPDFGLKREVDYIESVLQISETGDIMEKERRVDILKWEMADDITTFDYFSVEKILAFIVKAGITYRWTKLDAKIGEEMFQKLVKDLRETYELPKEFEK